MTKNKLTKAIDNYQSKIEDDARNYIGASSIGSECLRQIWYQFKGVKGENVSSKIRRTWAIGKHLELLVIEWLKQSGFEIDTSPWTYYASDMAYFQGHFDGILNNKGERSILEIKTAKDSSFNIFVNKGLKIWNPQYYSQVQAYMGMSEIDNAFILVLNKDNSELSDELVEFDASYYEKLISKAQLVHGYREEPPRVNNSPLWFMCKMCKYNKVCHK